MDAGIVGLPNVGKSTIFNAITAAGAESANYPFCTIEPNLGRVAVPDSRLETLAKLASSAKTIPTVLEFVDIAGLVAGASKGEGLGNQFLANIRETDAIVQVVRCFNDDNVIHVAGKVDPADDIEVITTELALADLETVEKGLLRAGKLARAGNKEAVIEVALLERTKAQLNEGKPARALKLSKEEWVLLKPLQLLTLKPTLYVANVAEDGFTNNPLLDRVMNIAKNENAQVVAICATIEAEIVKNYKNDKVLIFKKRRRKNSRRKRGHRQQMTEIKILSIHA